MRIREVITYEDGKALAEIALASTETKPTDGLATGSTITEADTGKTFVLDEDSATWTEYTSGGGGGGGSSWTLLHEEDIEVSTTSTSAINVKTINVPGAYTGDLIVCVATDTLGVRAGYLTRTLSFMANAYAASGSTYDWSSYVGFGVKRKEDDSWGSGNAARGIFIGSISSNDDVVIKAQYNSSMSGTIDSTYHIAIYKLSLPDGTPSPFA